jgi:hypothetical protein
MTNTSKKRYILLLLLAVLLPYRSIAQDFTNTFETPDADSHWFNTFIISDSMAFEGSHYSKCDSVNEYGLGFEIPLDEIFQVNNLKLNFNAFCKFQTEGKDALLVVSIENGNEKTFWQSNPITELVADSSLWKHLSYSTILPADYLKDGKLKMYIWNPNKNIICIDSARLQMKAAPMPKYLPQIKSSLPTEGLAETKFASRYYKILYYNDSHSIILADTSGKALTGPIVKVCIHQTEKTDSIITSNNHWMADKKDNLLFTSKNDFEETTLKLIPNSDGSIVFESQSRYTNTGKILRQAIAIPFIDSTLTLYRKNKKCDSTRFQKSYYLDREGFIIGKENRTVATYHQMGISSLQFDVENNIAYFNADFWRDHPLIHYPLSDDTTDYFVDLSAKTVDSDDEITGRFTLNIGTEIKELPRIMPVNNGYESAIIFTEHADWTDIKTQRAILFGNEKIEKAENAVGGFIYFDIPVTKSVFYNNPDKVTNAETSQGRFPNMHATIKTDKEFYHLLKNLDKKGFDICLHTPEQYSTEQTNLAKALSFMKRKFGSPSWIDHGYNNGSKHNRENMVCDGLNPESAQYAAKLWKKYGVKYLWNAYYEENRMNQWVFDGNLMQPYSGFGDALPNRQITTLPETNDFLLWATPSTLEVHSNDEWYYFYATERLQRLVDNHDVHITHIYPAWTNTIKGFWEYDEDSTIVARPGFNFALQQIANLRDEHMLLPTTIASYLDYAEKLNQIEYQIHEDGTISLVNHGKTIKGLTLLCANPISVDNKIIDFRKCGNEYLIWFDLKSNEKVNIRFR